jgi:hypothetical protein
MVGTRCNKGGEGSSDESRCGRWAWCGTDSEWVRCSDGMCGSPRDVAGSRDPRDPPMKASIPILIPAMCVMGMKATGGFALLPAGGEVVPHGVRGELPSLLVLGILAMSMRAEPLRALSEPAATESAVWSALIVATRCIPRRRRRRTRGESREARTQCGVTVAPNTKNSTNGSVGTVAVNGRRRCARWLANGAIRAPVSCVRVRVEYSLGGPHLRESDTTGRPPRKPPAFWKVCRGT